MYLPYVCLNDTFLSLAYLMEEYSIGWMHLTCKIRVNRLHYQYSISGQQHAISHYRFKGVKCYTWIFDGARGAGPQLCCWSRISCALDIDPLWPRNRESS